MSSRGAWAASAVVILLVVVVGLVVTTWYTCGFRGCPDVGRLRGYIPAQASVVLDRRGMEIAKLYRVSRRIVPLDSMPAYVPEAFVAVEDKRFYHHHGVDWERVPGAVWADIREGSFAQGFSTITMQLARNLFPNRLPAAEKSPIRKLSEMRVAMQIERRYSKRDILQMYLNEIYFGHGAWGIEAAAEEYFGKTARQLTIPEAATLAGLPRSPSRENPRSDLRAAQARRNLVLALMARQGYLTAAQAERARATRIRLRRGPTSGTVQQAPYFLQEVRQELESRLGDAIYTQGLRIHTTLDLPTQRVAEAELERQLEAIERGAYGPYHHPRYDPRVHAQADTSGEGTPYLQGALLMLDSRTGDVVAWVGGRDFAQSHFDRVVQAKRQPGSAFKPFVYTAAVAAGYPPTYQLLDEPLVVPLAGGRTWAPQNYDDTFEGPVPMVEALQESRNVPTVRLASQVGLGRVIQVARRMGIDERLPDVPSLALGVADVTPYELIDAYTAFSSLGDRAVPRLVTSVEDRTGKEVWAQQPVVRPTLDPAVAFVMTSMLQRVVDYGTGSAVRAVGFQGPAAGKTGTTQQATDAWFVGFTPRLTMGIWIGFDRPTPITPSATGGALAGPVWGRIMMRTASPASGWTPPSGVDRLLIGPGGMPMAGDCPAPAGSEALYFVAGTEPMSIGCLQGLAQGADSGAADTTQGLSADTGAGWWSLPRGRIFGGADSAGATVGPITPAGTRPPAAGPPAPPVTRPPVAGPATPPAPRPRAARSGNAGASPRLNGDTGVPGRPARSAITGIR